MIDFTHILLLSSYYLNPYAIPPIIAASFVLLLGFLIFTLEKQSQFNRTFLYVCVGSAIWHYGYAAVLGSSSPEVALFWARVMYIGLMILPATLLHMSTAYTNRYKKGKVLVLTAYAVAVLCILLNGSRYFLSGVRQYSWGFYPDAGNGHPVFLVFIFFCLVLGLWNLIRYYRLLPVGIENKRTKFLVLAFIFVSLGNIDMLASYGIGIYPFGHMAVLLFILSMTYSIIKYESLVAERHARQLEKEVNEKTKEIFRIVEELKHAQVKLIETGKISAIASLSAGILHQISQPVTAIHGFARFLKKEMKETDTFYKPIKIMEEQAVYLKDMLEDLMELIHHREIKKENINVNVSVKRAADLLTDELRIKRVNWNLILADNLPLVYADAVHLQQIFMNIMVNAMQILGTLPKGIERQLKVTSKFDTEKNKVVVMFEDNGTGMSAETQGQIFEPFFSTKTKGSGIGLALCKDLIAEHGGEISFHSKPGDGTVFTITLPPIAVDVSVKEAQGVHNSQ